MNSCLKNLIAVAFVSLTLPTQAQIVDRIRSWVQGEKPPQVQATIQRNERSAGTDRLSISVLTPSASSMDVIATLSPGVNPSDRLVLTIEMGLPASSRRVCLAYTGFEVVGVERSSLKYGGLDASTRKCLQAPDQRVTDSVTLGRFDVPFKAPGVAFDCTKEADAQDGLVLAHVLLDGAIHTYRIDSVYFRKDFLQVPSCPAGQ